MNGCKEDSPELTTLPPDTACHQYEDIAGDCCEKYSGKRN